MLRITLTESTAAMSTLKLEGRVTGAAVDELRRQCEALGSPETRCVSLDLADVSFIDHQGLDLFRVLGRRNVAVTHCSPFVAELLKEVLPCS